LIKMSFTFGYLNCEGIEVMTSSVATAQAASRRATHLLSRMAKLVVEMF
jgi:hypothetical protein